MTRTRTLFAAALLLIPAAASAHALLRESIPAVGSTVHTPPQQITLFYNEGVVPAFTTVTVTNAAGAHFEAGGPHRTADDPRQVAVPLKPLPPGTYRVLWHALSVDTHRTEGSFSFHVGR